MTKKNQWIAKHVQDKYVKLAQKDNFRSRASYKLLEINSKYHIIQKQATNVIIDLGAAPGGFSQVVARHSHLNTKIIAVDLLEMKSIAKVSFIQGDFRDANILKEIDSLLQQQSSKKAQLIMSDMSPNLSGDKFRDQCNIIELCELILDFALQYLQNNGYFLVKIFQGHGFVEYRQQLIQNFTKVICCKPEA